MSVSPLAPFDAEGQHLIAGGQVTVLSVASCARGLPREDQERLVKIVGQQRQIVHLDEAGFVWLSFELEGRGDDFCLLPSELRVA